MKRFLGIILIITLLLSSLAFAESGIGRTDDAVIFETAVDMLRQMDSRESVEEALTMFNGITSNYNQSKYFGIYTSAMLEIYDGKYDEAEAKIAILEMNDEFVALLRNNGLQPCGVLRDYIQASRLEASGDRIAALKLFSSISLKDSPEKSIELIGLVYEDALALYNGGKYEEAAEAFSLLGSYKDSAELAKQATALIPTPTPEPTPIPEPTPTPEPTLKPIPEPTEESIRESISERVQICTYHSEVDGFGCDRTVFLGEFDDLIDFFKSCTPQELLDFSIIRIKDNEHDRGRIYAGIGIGNENNFCEGGQLVDGQSGEELKVFDFVQHSSSEMTCFILENGDQLLIEDPYKQNGYGVFPDYSMRMPSDFIATSSAGFGHSMLYKDSFFDAEDVLREDVVLSVIYPNANIDCYYKERVIDTILLRALKLCVGHDHDFSDDPFHFFAWEIMDPGCY